MAVPSQFYGKLIGKGGSTKSRLERETGAKLTIPGKGRPGDVLIDGDSQGAVLSCRTQVELLVDAAVQASPPTHFLSIPLVGDEFELNLGRFKETCLEMQRREHGGLGLESELFTDPAKLHLTLGVLKLHQPAEVERAAQLLRGCAAELAQFLPLRIEVKGVEYMNDDPNAVDVLFAKVGPEADPGSDRLQQLADHVVSVFREASLLEPEHDRVKLHATVINSKKRRAGGGQQQRGGRRGGGGGGGRVPFVAEPLLQRFPNFVFGSSELSVVHLSRMVPSRSGRGGYYEAEATVEL